MANKRTDDNPYVDFNTACSMFREAGLDVPADYANEDGDCVTSYHAIQAEIDALKSVQEQPSRTRPQTFLGRPRFSIITNG